MGAEASVLGWRGPFNISFLAATCLDSDALDTEALLGRSWGWEALRDELITQDGEDTCAGLGHTR